MSGWHITVQVLPACVKPKWTTTMLSNELDITAAAVPENLLHTAETSVLFVPCCSASVTAVLGVLYCAILLWRGLCVLWHKDQACVDQKSEGCTGIIVDYSGQTSQCQDWSCSNRSRQILSDVLGPLPWKCLLWRQTMEWHTYNPSLLEDTSAVCFHVVMTFIDYSGN